MNISRRHLIGYSVTAVVAMGIGGGLGNAATADKPAKVITDTKTIEVPGPTVTVTSPPVTVTVNVPGPVKTITVTEPAPPPETAMAGDGTYEVGVDIKPGTYVSPPPEGNCYWARMKAGDGIDNIIANNNSSGQSVVTIRATDKFFESSGCSDWTKR